MKKILFKVILSLSVMVCLTFPGRAADVSGMLETGFAAFEKGYYDEAIAQYNKVIEIDPKNADAYFVRGLAWDMSGNHNKATADYNKAIELDPSLRDKLREALSK